MKEYWVNVYDSGYCGDNQESRHRAIRVAYNRNSMTKEKCVSRIHVKMDGGYNKYKDERLYLQTVGRANRKLDIKIVDPSKFNWMG